MCLLVAGPVYAKKGGKHGQAEQGGGITLEMDADRPYTWHSGVRARYPGD